ncbi:hypothetical protein IZ6_12080 [Terrihabitans soli]|uniref:Uncharacterized protein n=1 Tax=Terrihabitans soli TaxID=708113 RepID=A0A6S6QH35_9HYPH|nr:hypothetical protein IZ6_12080 [Terrihabitans soli]
MLEGAACVVKAAWAAPAGVVAGAGIGTGAGPGTGMGARQGLGAGMGTCADARAVDSNKTERPASNGPRVTHDLRKCPNSHALLFTKC